MAKKTTTFSIKPILFVQINDVYHIDASADFSKPDTLLLPRIATMVNRLKRLYSGNRVLFCLPGDFLGPSCLSKEFKGKQMVDVLNAMNLDFVTAGNHEFDFSIDEIINRFQESSFSWVLTNFNFGDALPDHVYDHGRFLPSHIIKLSDDAFVMIIGLMYEAQLSDPAHDDRVVCHVESPSEIANDAIDTLVNAMAEHGIANPRPFVIALTHQKKDQDAQLARDCPRIKLIMGGHDHDVVETTSAENSIIVKSLSNARSVRLNWLITCPSYAIDEFYRTPADAYGHLLGRVIGQALPKILFNTKGLTKNDRAEFGEELAEFIREGTVGEQYIKPVRYGDEDEGDGDFLQIAGIKVHVGENLQLSVTRNAGFGKEQQIAEENLYTVVTTDYVADRAYQKFFSPLSFSEVSINLRDAVAEGLTAVQQFEISTDAIFSAYNEPRWRGEGFAR